VWASLGLFPVAGQSLFLVNAPAFRSATLEIGDREFVIETRGHRETSISSDGLDGIPPPQYVQSARLNGKPLDAAHLSAADVHAGGTLRLELGPQPSEWGRKVLPPSLSDPLGKGTRR
jgi:putative alpha-1,2-mannosidase